jgi:hypothetical protein
MTTRLALLAAALAAAAFGAQRAEASTVVGSPDPYAQPDAFACAACPPGATMAFQQFALRGATVEAPEDGVLVSAGVNAKRLAGSEQPRIAVLRPSADGVSVADSAPVPVSSPSGATEELDGLHLAVRRGDSIGMLVPSGQVDLGTRARRKPDGAVQWFTPPCDPCGSDGGTGVELLFNAVVEPDVDADGLGDESQDPDGGGLGMDWTDDWFEDYDEGDELDPDFDEDAARRSGRARLRLLAVERRRGRGAVLILRVPRAGAVSAAVTLPSNRRTGAGPFLTILTGTKTVAHAGKVRLRVRATGPGARLLARRARLRTKVVVSLAPRSGPLKVRMRSARL